MTTDVDLDEVTVVCVTYNSSSLIERMARTLAGFRHVVLVDNASSDGSAALAEQLIPHARVIACASNAGFGGANNRGMAIVTTPFALLLNPDCTITPESVRHLLRCMARFPRAGIVGAQNWKNASTPQPSHRDAFFKPRGSDAYEVPKEAIKAEWIHGCCQLVRSSAFCEVGGFDETFFLYYEDDDLCLRMIQAGFECLLEPAARSCHQGRSSSAPSIRTDFIRHFHYARSRHIAIRRYVGVGTARMQIAKLLFASAAAIPLYALLLQRRHVVKWTAWGCASLTAAMPRTWRRHSAHSGLAARR